MKLTLSLFVALLVAPLAPLHAADSPTKSAADLKAESALTPIEDVSGLPRVLLIGDSISIGYTKPTRALLNDKANVHRPPTNCSSTGNGLSNLKSWLGEKKWDVIHFNFGLHDVKLPPEGVRHAPPAVYEKNLRELVKQMQATGAKLIFATTTPVPNGGNLQPTRRFGSVDQYNTIALKVMKETGVTCCPARTGLMTSKWPASYAAYPANGGFGNRVTITELLHKAGYATGHFGKWHIGPDEKAGVYGLDVVRSIDESGRKMIETTRGRDARVYDEAIRFIEQHKEGPFYVNVWSHISHHKIAPPASYVEKFKDIFVDESKFAAPMREKFAACKARGGDVSEHMRRYLADIYSMDEDIGRLLKCVDELGLRDNTIVVFSSDQGPAPLEASASKDPEARKQQGKNGKPQSTDTEYARLDSMGYVGDLRGGKTGMYEGGVRVPWIVRWPGHTPAGRVDSESVLSGIDWLPTLCAITGVKANASDFEGEDTSVAWMGKSVHVRTKPLLWKSSAPGSSAGIREAQWKLIYPTRRNGGDFELYDIVSDPAEMHNVAAQHPDVVKTLSDKVQAWVATLPKEYIKTIDTEK